MKQLSNKVKAQDHKKLHEYQINDKKYNYLYRPTSGSKNSTLKLHKFLQAKIKVSNFKICLAFLKYLQLAMMTRSRSRIQNNQLVRISPPLKLTITKNSTRLTQPIIKFYNNSFKFITKDSITIIESIAVFQHEQRADEFLFVPIDRLEKAHHDFSRYRLIMKFCSMKKNQLSTCRFITEYQLLHYPLYLYGTKEDSQNIQLSKSNLKINRQDKLFLNIGQRSASQGLYYPIENNQVFKLGEKCIIKVIALYPYLKPSDQHSMNTYFIKKINTIAGYKKNYPQEIILAPQTICRICLHNNQENQDEMVAVCRCKGSCGYIHATCLFQWIKGKFKVTTMSRQQGKLKVTICIFDKYFCEICKYELPKVLQQNGKFFNFIDIPAPEPPFIVFYCHTRNQTYELYILNWPIDSDPQRLERKNQINLKAILGHNGSDLDLPFPTSTKISKKHVEINLKSIKNQSLKFYIKNLSEQNDTFIQVKEQIEVKAGDTYELNDYLFKFE